MGPGRVELQTRATGGGGPDASHEEIDASPAVRLFRERAGAQGRRHRSTPIAPGRLLGEICRRVDGLPLAIELAAARVVGLDLEDISLHLDDLFDLLPQAAPAGRRCAAVAPRHGGVERRPAHRGGTAPSAADGRVRRWVRPRRRSRRSARATARPRRKVADLTARLVEKSLLLKQGDSGLYQLLETIRQYAAEQLDAAGETGRHPRTPRALLPRGRPARIRRRRSPGRSGHTSRRSARIEDNTARRARVPPRSRSSGGAGARGQPQLLLVDPGQASRGHRLARAGTRKLRWMRRPSSGRRAFSVRVSSSPTTPTTGMPRPRSSTSESSPRRRQRTSADPRHAALPAWGVRRLQRRPEVRHRSHAETGLEIVVFVPRDVGPRASACGTWPMHGWPTGTRTPPSRSSPRRSILASQRGLRHRGNGRVQHDG